MEIREKILIQAHSLFIENGIRSVTMDDLARSLGMSKRTIYEHFGDKNELVGEDAKSFAIDVKKTIEDIIEESENVIYALPRVMQYMKDIVFIVNVTYFEDLKKFYPQAHKCLVEDSSIRNFSVTDKFVQKGIEQGIFRSNMNIRLVSTFVNEILFNYHREMLRLRDVKVGDYEKDILFAYFLGIATESGYEIILRVQTEFFQKISVV